VDEVRFLLEVEDLGIGAILTVNPYINGVHLRDLARAVELPAAEADGQPELAGSYAGLAADPEVCWPSRHFLGAPRISWFDISNDNGADDAETVLLGCVCGEAGCWPLACDVIMGHDVVVWQHFRTGHRSWDLGGLGPFRFDRDQYEAAVRATQPPNLRTGGRR
jgi:hypothetical protein